MTDKQYITQNKYVKFYLENYIEIENLEEILEMGRKKLPGIIDNFIISTIKNMKSDLIRMGLVFKEKDDGELLWYHKDHYNEEEETGLYINYEKDGNFWKCLTSTNMEDYNCLGLCRSGKGSRKSNRIKDVKKWSKKLENNIKILSENKIQLNTDIDDEEDYLLYYYLNKEVNLSALKDSEKLKKNIKKAVINFTDTVMSILK